MKIINGIDVLIQSSLDITLNASDTFHYSAADGVKLVKEDLVWAAPIAQEFGHDGVTAIMAHITGKEPLAGWRNKRYLEAKARLEKLNPEVESAEFN